MTETFWHKYGHVVFAVGFFAVIILIVLAVRG